MTDVRHDAMTLKAKDNHRIHVQAWRPAGDIRGVVQIVHGLGEHGDRYARFAQAAVVKHLAVIVHDHRGHGEHDGHPGFFADANGWQHLVDDTRAVHEMALVRYPDVAHTMVGHSMGSYVAQNFAMHYGGSLSGLVLSASTWRSRLQLYPALLVAHAESWRIGRRQHSTLLDRLGFDSFNKRFRPARTGLDWISRDGDEVDAYIADPLCGGPYTCGLWTDLLAGLIAISSDHAITRIPADLPILITGGGDDPVGGEKGMTALALHYAQTSHQRLTIKIYAEGRHEMLNETNRDEVTADWLEWISARRRRT